MLHIIDFYCQSKMFLFLDWLYLFELKSIPYKVIGKYILKR